LYQTKEFELTIPFQNPQFSVITFYFPNGILIPGAK
jgi:hypothetical protein